MTWVGVIFINLFTETEKVPDLVTYNSKKGLIFVLKYVDYESQLVLVFRKPKK